MSAALDVIATAMANAAAMRDAASSQLSTALSTLGQPKLPDQTITSFSAIKADFTLSAVPQYGGLHYEAPVFTAVAPTMQPVPVADYGDAPVNTAVNPGFVEPQRPSGLGAFSGVAPVPNDLTIPPAPSALSSLDLTPPTLTDIIVPPAPTVTLPAFDAVSPNTDIAAPTDFSATFAAEYSGISVSMRGALNGELDAQLLKINPNYATAMATLEARLQTYIAGGTALPVAVEQAIYNRALDKTNDEYLATRDTVWEEGAKRGFTIPGGAQFSALTQARQAAADNNARAAMDIAIKQAEMEQTNIQFALTQSAHLREAVMAAMGAWFGNLIQLNGQGIEYARDLLNASIALYDTMVKIATARIEIYKADAQVYEIRLRAVMAVYDVYRAEIAGLEAQANVDTAKVNAFRARADALGALANAYRATIDGVVAKAGIEKLKVEIFGAQVQAFSAEVGAKQSEWAGFGEQVRGEVAKQGAYETEVRAYTAENQAWGEKVRGFSARVQAVNTQNEGAARIYESATRAYTALVQGASESARAEIASYESTLHAFIAQVTAQEAFARLSVTAQEAVLRAAVAQYGTESQIAIAASNGYNTYMTHAADVVIGAAKVYGDMAGSAMAGISALGAEINNQTR